MSQKNKFLLLFIVLAMPISGAGQVGPAQEVQKLERAWLDAYERLDQKAMDQIVADDFLITFPTARYRQRPRCWRR